MPKLLPPILAGRACAHPVGELVRAAPRGREHAHPTRHAPHHRVYHGHVADDHGDEGFAAGPAAGLFGAVGAGLDC
jgi:hypothetical protein